MTHDEALAWLDNHADNRQRARVKKRLSMALNARNADLFNSDNAGRNAIVAAEISKAVEAEINRLPLPKARYQIEEA